MKFAFNNKVALVAGAASGLGLAAAKAFAQAGASVMLTDWSVDALAAAKSAALESMLKSVPMGRYGRAEESADVVLFLCSEAASFVTGQAISVDGGFITR